MLEWFIVPSLVIDIVTTHRGSGLRVCVLPSDFDATSLQVVLASVSLCECIRSNPLPTHSVGLSVTEV